MEEPVLGRSKQIDWTSWTQVGNGGSISSGFEVKFSCFQWRSGGQPMYLTQFLTLYI